MTNSILFRLLRQSVCLFVCVCVCPHTSSFACNFVCEQGSFLVYIFLGSSTFRLSHCDIDPVTFDDPNGGRGEEHGVSKVPLVVTTI